MTEKKSIKIYRGAPIDELLKRLPKGGEKSLSFRINEVIGRYLYIIESDNPGESAEEIAEKERKEQ